MATKPQTAPLAEVKTNNATLVREQAKAINEIGLIKGTLKKGPIKNDREYQEADKHRESARGLKKYFLDLINPGIDALNQAKSFFLESRKVVTNDADEVIEYETQRMIAYKNEERRLIREAEEAAQAERDRLQAIADAKLQKARMLKTVGAKAKAEDSAAEAQLAAESVSVKVSAVEGDSSEVRTTLKVRVTDKNAFIEYIGSREVSTEMNDLLDVNMPELNAYFKLSGCNKPLKDWLPGIEVYEDINIFSRKKS